MNFLRAYLMEYQMVQVHRYFDEEETAFRRYSGRGHGYPISHDRELPSGPSHGPYGGHHRHHQQSAHDNRAGGQSPEQEANNANTRRRIPVAVSSTKDSASTTIHLVVAKLPDIYTVRPLQEA